MGTRYTELEALAVALDATRFLASASFSVLNGSLATGFEHLRLEGSRVAFADIRTHLFYLGGVFHRVAAVSAATFGTAAASVGEAFTVELKALRLSASAFSALFGNGLWCGLGDELGSRRSVTDKFIEKAFLLFEYLGRSLLGLDWFVFS